MVYIWVVYIWPSMGGLLFYVPKIRLHNFNKAGAMIFSSRKE